MKKPIIIILLCLACGLFSCTQTDSGRIKSVGKTMATSIDSNYYAKNIFYNPYKKVEKKNSETNIWAKEKNNSSKTETKILDNCELAKKIHSNSGLFSSSKKLNEYIENINADNVINIVESYKRWYGKSIFNEIMRNIFISSDTRAEAVKHIKDMLMQAMKRSGTYTEDYDKLIDGHIDYEKNKFGRMKSKDIDEDLRALFDRHRQTRRGKNYNKLIPANGKIDATFNQGYVMDCWLLSAIKSLSINPKGLEMLEDLISIDDKGNVTVQLKGVKRTYTISKEELEGANEFAQGDLDIRAIELAVNKYLHEIGDHGGNKYNDAKISKYYYDIYDGNFASIPYRILFNKPVGNETHPNKETIEQIKSGEYSIVVLSRNNYEIPGCYFNKCHIYAVTGADDNYVYLSDPYSPDERCSITHSNFIKFFNISYSMKF
jgi:uncharacterized protein YeeX (DUF496 family)